jgi:hypothetical protein
MKILRLLSALGVVAAALFIAQHQALAANTISTSIYEDNDANGTLNWVAWTMDESVTGCTYEAGDWTVNTASELNISITGLTCVGSVLRITVTADANETGAATAPVISYNNTDGDNSVTLTSGAMTAKASVSTTDGARPVAVSVSPANAAEDISKTADIVLTFSEAMDTTFAEGTEFSMTPDPGTFSVAWTVLNSVATLSFPDLACNTNYDFLIENAQIVAASGTGTLTLGTGGPVSGDSNFTTGSTGCGGTAGYVPPQITSFTYTGPVCTTPDAHAFAIVGSNIDAYLVDDNALFTFAEWQDLNIEGSGSFNAVFDGTDAQAYAMLKSADGSYSNVFNFDLSSWTEACAEIQPEEPAVDDEPAPEPEDSDSVGDAVSPGDTIMVSGSTTVYYVTENYGRRIFLNEAVYYTWFDSFTNVVTLDASLLSELPLEGTMLPKAESVLVKIQSSPVVYWLDSSENEFSPTLRAIPDEATAAALFGSNWAAYIMDIEPTFFTKFNLGGEVSAVTNLDTNNLHLQR